MVDWIDDRTYQVGNEPSDELSTYVEKSPPMTFPWVRPSDEVYVDKPSDDLSDDNTAEIAPPMSFPDRPSDEIGPPMRYAKRPSDDYSGGPSAARVREAQTRLLELTACTCGGTWYGVYGSHHVDCPAPYREDVVVLVAMAELGRTVTRGYPRQAACATEARVTRNRS